MTDTTRDDNGGDIQLPPSATAGEHQSASGDEHHRHITAAVEKALHGHLAEHLTRVEQICASSVRDAVSTGRRRLDDVMRDHTPAWLRPTEGEPRWPVALAIVVAIGLQLAAPTSRQSSRTVRSEGC